MERDVSTLEDVLTPGEKILSECKPFFATSKRIIRFDDDLTGARVAELAYQQVSAVQLMRKPSHRMMAMGTAAFLCGLFLFAGGILVVTGVPAMIVGLVMLAMGARGSVGYYQLHIQNGHVAADRSDSQDMGWGPTVNGIIDFLGLGSPSGEALWRLDYARARSFIATIRTVKGDLPEI